MVFPLTGLDDDGVMVETTIRQQPWLKHRRSRQVSAESTDSLDCADRFCLAPVDTLHALRHVCLAPPEYRLCDRPQRQQTALGNRWPAISAQRRTSRRPVTDRPDESTQSPCTRRRAHDRPPIATVFRQCPCHWPQMPPWLLPARSSAHTR